MVATGGPPKPPSSIRRGRKQERSGGEHKVEVPLREAGTLSSASAPAEGWTFSSAPAPADGWDGNSRSVSIATTPEFLRKKDRARNAAAAAEQKRAAVEEALRAAQAAEEEYQTALDAVEQHSSFISVTARPRRPSLSVDVAPDDDDVASNDSSRSSLRGSSRLMEPENAMKTWGKIIDAMDSRDAADTVADGAAAKHAPLDRVEAARKMVSNHEVLLKDLTRADGPPVSQPALQRLPGRERDVDAFLKECARRLAGRLPEQGCRHTKPTSAQQSETWAAAAAYLTARLQVSSRDVAKVPGHTGRKRDMSPAAGLAFKAVLAEVAVEEIDCLATSTWGKLTDGLEVVADADSVADGAAAEFTRLACRQAARKLIGNHQAVCGCHARTQRIWCYSHLRHHNRPPPCRSATT